MKIIFSAEYTIWLMLLLPFIAGCSLSKNPPSPVVYDDALRGGWTDTVQSFYIDDVRFVPPESSAKSNGFVTTDGTTFVLNGKPFYYVGANCYYLMTYAADPNRRKEVDKVLEAAVAMGLKVIRTWAFNDGDDGNALQTSPGVYQERVFQGLDYVVWKSSQLGLRLILVMVNNWNDYGGMQQYARWRSPSHSHDDFYTDETIRQWFKDSISTLINRKNHLNGKPFKEDPTIMAWELANEPRTKDRSGSNLKAWVTEMSQWIKSLDSNHLVTTGSEGRDFFVEMHQIPSVDFCTVHIWPDHWGWDLEQSVKWLTDRIEEAHTVVQKPIILEEFGKYRDTIPPVPNPPRPTGGTGKTATRDKWYERLLRVMYQRKAAGANFWILYHDTYPDYDGFGVYYPFDKTTTGVIRATVARMNELQAP